uniref:Uncharacterized protein n=1 Tax=Clytia hemisphaerica TaxID=252671 RepID=A0A7M6DLE1_9CNID
MTTEEKLSWYQKSNFFVYKNLLVVSLAEFCNFFAFSSTQSLQSSLNAERGFISLCVLYVFCAVCLLFLPKLLIACIGFKFSIALAIFGYTIYQMIQFHPATGMMIFGAISVGFSGSVFWVAVPSPITVLARQHSQHTGKDFEMTNQKFYAMYYFLFRFSLVPSNLLLSSILKHNDRKVNYHTNSTLQMNLQCGIKACPTLTSTLSHVNIKDAHRLFWIYLEVGLSGVPIILLFFSNIKEQKDNQEEDVWVVVKDNLVAVLKIFREMWILELFIISMAQGMVQSFIIGDMTKVRLF